MPRTLLRLASCLAALILLVVFSRSLISLNSTTAALCMLLLVLATATKWGLTESIFSSFVGMLTFNFFFLPPVGTFTIADPENLVALFAFLVTAVTASHLSTSAKHRAQEALTGRNEIARLYELSRALLMEQGRDELRSSVVQIEKVMKVGPVAFLDLSNGEIYGTLEQSGLTAADLTTVASSGERLAGTDAVIIPVRMGTRTIGSLATVPGTLSPEVLESVASLLAINYERAAALDRATAAEAGRRNEEFKSSLLDGLAHDLKTPLTAIRTCITRLITIPPRTEEVRQELLTIIDQESERLQATITEAIELARLESSDLRLEREPTEVAELVQVALSEVRDETPERYSVHVKPRCVIDVDRNLFKRALGQVLENARKYSPPNSPILLEAFAAGEDVVIRILDRGSGIMPEDLERVFEKFYRSRRARDRVEGTGMGLTIARAIAEAHGGTIRAEQRSGGGTVITFTIPCSTQ